MGRGREKGKTIITEWWEYVAAAAAAALVEGMATGCRLHSYPLEWEACLQTALPRPPYGGGCIRHTPAFGAWKRHPLGSVIDRNGPTQTALGAGVVTAGKQPRRCVGHDAMFMSLETHIGHCRCPLFRTACLSITVGVIFCFAADKGRKIKRLNGRCAPGFASLCEQWSIVKASRLKVILHPALSYFILSEDKSYFTLPAFHTWVSSRYPVYFPWVTWRVFSLAKSV